MQYIILAFLQNVSLYDILIYTGINEVISKFQYMANVKSVNEYFYWTRSNCPKNDSEQF